MPIAASPIYVPDHRTTYTAQYVKYPTTSSYNHAAQLRPLLHSRHLRRPNCMNCRAASTSSHSGPLLCLSVPAPRPIIPLAATTKMPLQVHLGCGPYTPARHIHRDLIDQADSPTSLM
jgi:hypothetical protein